MKNILLKLASGIYRHYNKSIEVKFSDTIKFNGEYFRIVSVNQCREIGYVNTLDLKLHDVSESLNYIMK